jgi:nucleoside-diphosphate-sugar epimerase
MKKVLLTGASGFIGRHCIGPLMASGYEVHALSNKSALNGSNIHWHLLDLMDGKKLGALMEEIQPTHLLHLAWDVTHGVYWTSQDNLRWVQASLDLLRAFQVNGGKRVVAAGTCAEYDWRSGYCTERITPYLPTSLYGACKLSLHTVFEAFARQTGLSAGWGHIFFLFGPNEQAARLVASAITSLLRRQPIRCTHGRQIRDFLYVKDVANAFVSLLNSDVTGPVNIGSGNPITLREIIVKVAEQMNGEQLIQFGAVQPAPDEPLVLLPETRRIHQEVGWSEKYDIDSGLSETIDWWRSQSTR